MLGAIEGLTLAKHRKTFLASSRSLAVKTTVARLASGGVVENSQFCDSKDDRDENAGVNDDYLLVGKKNGIERETHIEATGAVSGFFCDKHRRLGVDIATEVVGSLDLPWLQMQIMNLVAHVCENLHPGPAVALAHERRHARLKTRAAAKAVARATSDENNAAREAENWIPKSGTVKVKAIAKATAVLTNEERHN